MLAYAELSRREGIAIPRSPDFTRETKALNVLDLVNLTPFMELTGGRPEIVIGLVDGPVVIDHPDLTGENVREIPGRLRGTCTRASSFACMHKAFVAGILSAKRSSAAPAICQGCTLLVRPIFSETPAANELIPSAKPEELAAAIIECIEAGARLVNLSAALAQVPSTKDERALGQALHHAANRGAVVVAAAGNQGTVWQHGHHTASMGHRGDRLRPPGQTTQRIQFWEFHRSPRSQCAGPGHHQSWHGQQAGLFRRHQRRGSFCRRSPWYGRSFPTPAQAR